MYHFATMLIYVNNSGYKWYIKSIVGPGTVGQSSWGQKYEVY